MANSLKDMLLIQTTVILNGTRRNKSPVVASSDLYWLLKAFRMLNKNIHPSSAINALSVIETSFPK